MVMLPNECVRRVQQKELKNYTEGDRVWCKLADWSTGLILSQEKDEKLTKNNINASPAASIAAPTTMFSVDVGTRGHYGHVPITDLDPTRNIGDRVLAEGRRVYNTRFKRGRVMRCDKTETGWDKGVKFTLQVLRTRKGTDQYLGMVTLPKGTEVELYQEGDPVQVRLSPVDAGGSGGGESAWQDANIVGIDPIITVDVDTGGRQWYEIRDRFCIGNAVQVRDEGGGWTGATVTRLLPLMAKSEDDDDDDNGRSWEQIRGTHKLLISTHGCPILQTTSCVMLCAHMPTCTHAHIQVVRIPLRDHAMKATRMIFGSMVSRVACCKLRVID
jgi:hypothetical protein